MASPTAASSTAQCPACGAAAVGKFCSNCGASLAGATCNACSAPLTPGARFCHRCGTPAGAERQSTESSFSNALPWGVAAIALIALIALMAGQRFARSRNAQPIGDASQASGQAPNISNMSPAEAAVRLYNRVMGAHERGQTDTVQIFAPMAIAAFQMIDSLDLDQRYDMGRIAAVSGDEQLARAQADTILARSPNHLLGLILAGNAARMRKDQTAERTYHDRLVASAPAERAKRLAEYLDHDNDITFALDAKRP